MRAMAGANRKTGPSAAAGVMSSFCANLTPSATNWAQPWKPPAYIGPTLDCMCAIALCSVWPTSSGSTRNAARTPNVRPTTSHQSIISSYRRCPPEPTMTHHTLSAADAGFVRPDEAAPPPGRAGRTRVGGRVPWVRATGPLAGRDPDGERGTPVAVAVLRLYVGQHLRRAL